MGPLRGHIPLALSEVLELSAAVPYGGTLGTAFRPMVLFPAWDQALPEFRELQRRIAGPIHMPTLQLLINRQRDWSFKSLIRFISDVP